MSMIDCCLALPCRGSLLPRMTGWDRAFSAWERARENGWQNHFALMGLPWGCSDIDEIRSAYRVTRLIPFLPLIVHMLQF